METGGFEHQNTGNSINILDRAPIRGHSMV
jgi:hypothetical protein